MTEKKNGIIQEYFDLTKAKIYYEFFIFNGKKEGEYKYYYKNGQLASIYNYKNDNLEGERKTHYDNGQLYVVSNYVNNHKEGKYKRYSDNGQLKTICNYKNDTIECEKYYNI